jgi:hypothetical protein
MENEKLREYQVIWWTEDCTRPRERRERLTVHACSLDDASMQITEMYGSNIKTSIWNEEDAAKPR